jgi:hypothetical protein
MVVAERIGYSIITITLDSYGHVCATDSEYYSIIFLGQS